jgi:hypothetical protein
VENAVQVAQRWIIAALRHQKFFSLEEANLAIGELLHRLNHRPFRKRDGSRASVFESLDKPALKPLPGAHVDVTASKLLHATYLAGNSGGTGSVIAVSFPFLSRKTFKHQPKRHNRSLTGNIFISRCLAADRFPVSFH